MKHYFSIAFFSVFFLNACSKIEEKNEPESQPLSNLTVDNIQTDLPVLNIVTDQKEFDKMHLYFNAALEIDARLFLYRKKALVIENEEITLEIKGSHTAQFDLKQLGMTFENVYDNSDRSLLNPLTVLPFHNLDQI